MSTETPASLAIDAIVVTAKPSWGSGGARGFTGREQVRKNWQDIFTIIGDVHAEVLRVAVDGDTVWSEWEHRGTRPDRSPHVMRGVVIFGVTGGVAHWARFYLEPLQEEGDDVDASRRRQLGHGERS